uniref:LicD/FKTN/FKRP nucleotidyltransferase domain-containing protein n=1 Tax=viral metagenome TaxID=1070528 RepID=A0A6C0BZJ8_9ZZZZ
MPTSTSVIALIVICVCVGLLCVHVVFKTCRNSGRMYDKLIAAPYSKSDKRIDASTELVYTVKGKIYKYYDVPLDIMKMMPYIDRHTRLRDELVDLLQVFSEACAKCNVRWWLDYGTCLGWLRNGAIIPWDDDMDISMRKEDEARLLSDVGPAIRAINPNITLLWCYNRLIKVVRKPKCFPWIDIIFHSREAGDVWIANHTRMKNGKLVKGQLRQRTNREPIPNGKLFPLLPASLHGVEVYVPQDPKHFMEIRFGKNSTHELKYTHLHYDEKVCKSSGCKEV